MLRLAWLFRRTFRRRRATSARRRFTATLATRAAAAAATLFWGGNCGGTAGGDGVGVGGVATVGAGRIQLIRAEIAGRAAGVQVWRLICAGRLCLCGRQF